MRLLCVSDVHYHLPQMEWILKRAQDFDVVVLPGDHLETESPTPFGAQIADVSEYLYKMSQSAVVLAASGNHDLDGPGVGGEQRAGWLAALAAPSLFVDGQSVDLKGVRFTVCPWWDGPVTKAVVASQLRDAAVGRPEFWIWAYHSPPAGTRLCATGGGQYGDSVLAEWIDMWRPDMVICGHIHQAPWVEGGGWVDRQGRTWVFNAGQQIGHEPAHIVLDLSTQLAEWIAPPDKEEIDLSLNTVTVRQSS